MDLINLAIQASLNRNWKEAIKLNTQLLKGNPQDADALNRLAKALLQTGFKTKAEQTYKKVLKLDKYNPIATKGLEIIKSFRVERKSASVPAPDFTAAFLEEPGTTKTVSLIRLGDTKILNHLQPGDEVHLVAREHCVSIVTRNQDYIGRLPDDLASRLRPFLKAGNTYQAWLKSVDLHNKSQDKQNLKIFIKELSRSAKYRSIPSFPSTEKLSYAAFTPPELIHGADKPDISTPEEDTEEYPNAEEKLESETENEALVHAVHDNRDD
jgi:tetratricopeptide (TPR) repeat protein